MNASMNEATATATASATGAQANVLNASANIGTVSASASATGLELNAGNVSCNVGTASVSVGVHGGRVNTGNVNVSVGTASASMDVGPELSVGNVNVGIGTYGLNGNPFNLNFLNLNVGIGFGGGGGGGGGDGGDGEGGESRGTTTGGGTGECTGNATGGNPGPGGNGLLAGVGEGLRSAYNSARAPVERIQNQYQEQFPNYTHQIDIVSGSNIQRTVYRNGVKLPNNMKSTKHEDRNVLDEHNTNTSCATTADQTMEATRRTTGAFLSDTPLTAENFEDHFNFACTGEGSVGTFAIGSNGAHFYTVAADGENVTVRHSWENKFPVQTTAMPREHFEENMKTALNPHASHDQQIGGLYRALGGSANRSNDAFTEDLIRGIHRPSGFNHRGTQRTESFHISVARGSLPSLPSTPAPSTNPIRNANLNTIHNDLNKPGLKPPAHSEDIHRTAKHPSGQTLMTPNKYRRPPSSAITSPPLSQPPSPPTATTDTSPSTTAPTHSNKSTSSVVKKEEEADKELLQAIRDYYRAQNIDLGDELIQQAYYAAIQARDEDSKYGDSAERRNRSEEKEDEEAFALCEFCSPHNGPRCLKCLNRRTARPIRRVAGNIFGFTN